MPRYFIEVSYKGTHYSGFQIQQNAHSIQAEVEKALKIYYKTAFELTGSSRTDAGVHAMQNYFHFDSQTAIEDGTYHINAILPSDIVIKRIFPVAAESTAGLMPYLETIYTTFTSKKDPFLIDRGLFLSLYIEY